MVLPLGVEASLGTLDDFLLRVLLPRFDVVLSYDIGNGIRVEKGGDRFSQWPALRDNAQLPKGPRAAVETLTHYFRFCANLCRLNGTRTQVGCLVRSAQLLAPAVPGGYDYDLGALALLMRDWALDSLLTGHDLATFLITENLNDLHPILVNNPRCAQIKLPLPSPDELQSCFNLLAPRYPIALGAYAGHLERPARQLAGATLGSVENMLKSREHQKSPLKDADLSGLKKQLVEQECNGLIEFIESIKTLDELHGQDKIKEWLRQDFALWRDDDLQAMPMGYLLCGPVGTGKTYMVECLAGEAAVPVVKMKNFRDKWVGSTEGNLEKIFRLLHALGRCFVFIDEADQALGRRDAGSGDSGVSGRIYSMMAEEMSNPANRGRIVWILASSRPDLIEVDLKRPGRIDVKIPLFPTTTPEEGFNLIAALCRKRGLAIGEHDYEQVKPHIPELVTPGAAEALATKVYRLSRVEKLSPLLALQQCLADYQNPIQPEVLQAQIELAVREASDLEFVPQSLRRPVASR